MKNAETLINDERTNPATQQSNNEHLTDQSASWDSESVILTIRQSVSQTWTVAPADKEMKIYLNRSLNIDACILYTYEVDYMIPYIIHDTDGRKMWTNLTIWFTS